MGPMARPRPVVPDQMPMARARSPGAVKTLVRMDSVDGMMAAAPIPIRAARGDQTMRRAGEGREGRAGTEHGEAGHEHPFPPDPVAGAPENEKEAGEDHRVGVDDPLELARGGMHGPYDLGEGHVEDCVIEAHE